MGKCEFLSEKPQLIGKCFMNGNIRIILYDIQWCYCKEGKNKFKLIYLSWQDSAPTEVAESFPLGLIRNRMNYMQRKALLQKKKIKKNAPALLSNSKLFKAFYD